MQNINSILLKKILPPVRGIYKFDYPLSKITWFNVGGPADVVYMPKDMNDLICFIQYNKLQKIDYTVIGACSNLLVRDSGVQGVVIKLGKEFKTIEYDGLNISVGAGALGIQVSRYALVNGIGGFEFLSGIPGTIGGSIYMNAGAYGKEISDLLVSVEAVDDEGVVHKIESKDISFSYRSSKLDNKLILVRAIFRGCEEDRNVINKKINDIQRMRSQTQPIKRKTGGSTFKNPKKAEYKAWQLIEAAGCRGMVNGGAKVSDLHCNFLINTGNASAREIEYLGESIRNKVLSCTGINLDWEIKRVGKESEFLS